MRAKFLMKHVVALGCDVAGINRLGLRAQRWRYGAGHIRVINYHATPERSAANLERQLAWYAGYFKPARPEDIAGALGGEWRHDVPALLPTFDDGLRSHYDVAAPILEKHGFAGWFFAPVAHIEAARSAKAEFPDDEPGRAPILTGARTRATAERQFMNWEELRDLRARGHVVVVAP